MYLSGLHLTPGNDAMGTRCKTMTWLELFLRALGDSCRNVTTPSTPDTTLVPYSHFRFYRVVTSYSLRPTPAFFLYLHPAAGMLATVKCNHDVSILVHAPQPMASQQSFSDTAAQMAASIRAATFYISNYVSKGQPHLTNLWFLLRDGHARLLHELNDGTVDPTSRYFASRTLTRLLTSAEKRVHKTMPEMCHYLLGHDEAYTSHHFRRIFITGLVHRALALCPVATLSTLEPTTDFWIHPEAIVADPPAAESSGSFTRGYQDVDYLHRGTSCFLFIFTRRFPFLGRGPAASISACIPFYSCSSSHASRLPSFCISLLRH
jgi:hypothetical protein